MLNTPENWGTMALPAGTGPKQKVVTKQGIERKKWLKRTNWPSLTNLQNLKYGRLAIYQEEVNALSSMNLN